VSALAAAALGLVLGVVTGMPLGVVNVAVVDAALAGRARFATGIGIGGALADTTHAALAFIGVGQLLAARPELARGAAVVAAVILCAYAGLTWRARRTPVTARRDAHGRGVLAGALLTLPNPAALGAWVALAAALWPAIATRDALVLAAGVGIGSATWFAALARWSSRVRADHPARAYVPRVALVLLGVLAVVGLVRTVVA
jgi:arginine exporter protein ArgO